jgi:hypothetical protein
MRYVPILHMQNQIKVSSVFSQWIGIDIQRIRLNFLSIVTKYISRLKYLNSVKSGKCYIQFLSGK